LSREKAISTVLESDILEVKTPRAEPSDHLIRKAAKGGGIAFVGNVIDKGLRFPLEILLARVLGAGGYGSYSLGYGLMMIGSKISMLGLSSGVVRFAALYKGVGDIKRVKGTLSSAFVISTLSSVAVGGLLFLFSRSLSELFNMPELITVLRIFALAFPFYVITVMAGNAARAFQAISYEVVVTNICRPLANVAVVSMVFLLGFRLFGAVYGFLISSAISAVLGLFLLKRIFPDIISELKPSYEFWRLLRFSLPVLFIGFSYVLLNQTDRIMLGYFKASKDLGIYSAAAIISQQAGLITYSFSCIFCPIISDLYNRNEFRQLEKLYKTVTRWIVTLNLVLLILLIVFSKYIMAIFGPEFHSGWLVLVVLSSVHLVGYSAGGALAGYALQMSGKQDFELVNAMVMLVLNVALNFLLIPIYGILGAAMATGVSYAVINIARIVEVYKLLRMHPYDTNYHKLFIAGFAVVSLSILLFMFNVSRFSWIFSVVILITVYFATLYFLGLEYEDKMIWQTIKRRISN
jgi:O-antigen/teichoic acid export membrane protein